MNRRSFLASAAAAVTSTLVPAEVGGAGSEGDIVVRSRDRRVRFNECEYNGETYAEWRIESRHTGDEVYELSLPRGIVRHSHVSTDRVFVVAEAGAGRRRTMEWFLQGDFGRSRTVDRDGSTRIIDYHADGSVNRRV